MLTANADRSIGAYHRACPAIPGLLAPEVQPSFYIGCEFVQHINAGVDQDGVRAGDENRGPIMETLRPPHARESGSSVVAEELAVRGYHAARIVVPPDGVKERVSETAFVAGSGGSKVVGILVIDRLYWKHDTALNRVLPQMRSVTFRIGAPALPPLAWPVPPLIDSRPNSCINKVVDIDEVARIVAQLVVHAQTAPRRRLRSRDSDGRIRRGGIRRFQIRLLRQHQAGGGESRKKGGKRSEGHQLLEPAATLNVSARRCVRRADSWPSTCLTVAATLRVVWRLVMLSKNRNAVPLNAGLGFGFAAGCLLGILYAPQSGKRTRRRIADAVEEGIDQIASRAEDTTEYLREQASRLQNETKDFLDRGQAAIKKGKAQLEDALEKGADLYRAAST